jgi:SAM-dependent methyltransferase
MLGLRKQRPYSGDYSYQLDHMQHLPERGIILDVGSGANPFPKATILSDRFLEITAHRREEICLDHRPFMIFDIHHIPFKKKSIDYVYCSHVLEHVDNPEQACAELMRVGKAGFIETPTLMRDALFSWAKELNHKWYLVQFGNRLIFFEYDERRQQGVRSTQWREAILSAEYHPNQDLFYPNQDLFSTILEWNHRFDVTVFRLDQPEPTSLP